MAGDLLPYFSFYPAETLADERFSSWTLDERGAWVTLLLHAWVNGSIPGDLGALARILHVDATAMRALWEGIGDRFEVMDHLPEGRLSSPRLEREREEALARARAGKKGAKARWDKRKSSDATAMRPHTDRNAEPMPPSHPIPSHHSPSHRSQTASVGGGSDDLVGVRSMLAERLGLPSIVLGKSPARTLASFRRWLDRGLDHELVDECARIAAEKGVTPGSLSWWPGWIDTVPDQELERLAQLRRSPSHPERMEA